MLKAIFSCASILYDNRFYHWFQIIQSLFQRFILPFLALNIGVPLNGAGPTIFGPVRIQPFLSPLVFVANPSLKRYLQNVAKLLNYP